MSVCHDEKINGIEKGSMSNFTKYFFTKKNENTNLTLGSQEVNGFVDSDMGPEVGSYIDTKKETIESAFKKVNGKW